VGEGVFMIQLDAAKRRNSDFDSYGLLDARREVTIFLMQASICSMEASSRMGVTR